MPHLLERVIVVTAVAEAEIRKCPHIDAIWQILPKPVEVAVLEQELLACYSERLRVATRKPPRRAAHADWSLPIHRIAN
jgi:hypothetical protein